jgi:hypothetical protein
VDFIFPPGMPEEAREIIEQTFERSQMINTDIRTSMMRLIDTADQDTLETVSAMLEFASHDSEHGHYLRGQIVASARTRFGIDLERPYEPRPIETPPAAPGDMPTIDDLPADPPEEESDEDA